jgi:butyryl-CoA dehydrogenase
VAPVSIELDGKGEFPAAIFNKAFKMGLHLLDVPEEYGGNGLDMLTNSMLRETLAMFDAGFNLSLGVISLAAKPVSIAGTDAQKKLFYGVICENKFAAFALTESEAGSDAGAVKTTAVKAGSEYILNGTKCFITNGGVADIYTVIASTDKSRGIKGLSAFIVERGLEGVSVGKEENKMGIRLSNTCDVIFDNVRIPADHLIGKEGEGFKIAMKTLDQSRIMAAGGAVGIAQAAVNHAVKYAKERITFGSPIAKFQGIQFMLADMEMQTEAARQLTYNAANLCMAGKPFEKESAIAKCYAGDTAMKVTTDAVQILGGYGYMKEYPVEKLMRDAKIYQIFEGTNQIQRIVISGHMLR